MTNTPPVDDAFDAPDYNFDPKTGDFAAAQRVDLESAQPVETGDLTVGQDGTFTSSLRPEEALAAAQQAREAQEIASAAQPGPTPPIPAPAAPPVQAQIEPIRLPDGTTVTADQLMDWRTQQQNLAAQQEQIALAQQQFQNELEIGRAVLQNPAQGAAQAVAFAQSRGLQVPGLENYGQSSYDDPDNALADRVAQLEYELQSQRNMAAAVEARRNLEALDPNVDLAAVAHFARERNMDMVDAYKVMAYDSPRSAPAPAAVASSAAGAAAAPAAADQVAVAAAQRAASIAGASASSMSQSILPAPDPNGPIEDVYNYMIGLANSGQRF